MQTHHDAARTAAGALERAAVSRDSRRMGLHLAGSRVTSAGSAVVRGPPLFHELVSTAQNRA